MTALVYILFRDYLCVLKLGVILVTSSGLTDAQCLTAIFVLLPSSPVTDRMVLQRLMVAFFLFSLVYLLCIFSSPVIEGQCSQASSSFSKSVVALVSPLTSVSLSVCWGNTPSRLWKALQMGCAQSRRKIA